MRLLSQIGFIKEIADFLKIEYLTAFILFAACVLILAVLIVCIILLAVRKHKKRGRMTRTEKKAFESGQKPVAEVFYARDPAAGEPLLPLSPAERQAREIESSYKSFGGVIPMKPDISDNELLDIIYAEIVAKREDISKSAFFADKNFSQAYLEYVKERLARIMLRGLDTREALDIYFYGAPLAVTPRPRQIMLSELERQTIKQQKIRALEADIQTILLHITALEKTVEEHNKMLASSKNKKQKLEIRKKIAEVNKELELTRRQLDLMREKEASERQKEESGKEEGKPHETAAQPVQQSQQTAQPGQQPAPPFTPLTSQPAAQPFAPPVAAPAVFAGAQPLYAVQYVDYAQRAELMAELKALILLVNECHTSISNLGLRNAELSLKREGIRGRLSVLNAEAMGTPSDAELDRNMEAAQNLNSELNSLILDMEICAGDKAQFSRDIYNSHNRINAIIRQLSLTYQDVLKIEDELLAGGKGVMKGDEGVDWAKRSKAASGEMNSYINDEKERTRAQYQINAAAEEMDGLRKEYMRRMREMEEERIAFFRDYARAAHDQNRPETQIKPNAEVPADRVMLRRKDGSIVMVKHSELPATAKPFRMAPVPPARQAPARSASVRPAPARNVRLRVVKTLPDGSVIRSDGTMLRPDGRVLRPSKTKDGTSAQFREIVMTERRELQKQKEEAGQKKEVRKSDPLEEEISKIENALKEGQKGK